MTVTPKVVIGVPLYNRADYLSQALESLLAQTYRDFVLILMDDGSSDGTPEIARQYAATDRRIIYRKNGARLGLVRNWSAVFKLARALYPGAEYFAWASDHDLWHPRWLSTLVSEFERCPGVVFVYPRNLRISETGETLRNPWSFDTFGIVNRWERFRTATLGPKAGDRTYGLYRAKALARTGLLRPVLLPDNLMQSELALYGQSKQVPEVLWYRRFEGTFSRARQRRSFFPDGPPVHSYLPWTLTHTGALLYDLGVRGRGRPTIGRVAGVVYALGYLPLGAKIEARSVLMKGVVRPARAALRASRRRLRTAAKTAGLARRTRARVSGRARRWFRGALRRPTGTLRRLTRAGRGPKRLRRLGKRLRA